MCPCDVACKTVRLVEIRVVLRRRRPLGTQVSAANETGHCAVGATPHAVPYMLRRCVGFSWAKPSVTKSSTHLLVFLVFKSPGSPAPQALTRHQPL